MLLRDMIRTGGCTAMAFLGIAAFPAVANAYNFFNCGGNRVVWQNGWTNMWINTTSMPIGSVWDSRLQNAMSHWNNVKGSGFNFYVGRDTDGTFNNTNGVSEVYFTRGLGGPLAITYSRWNGNCNFTEADIGFDANYTWSVDPLDYGNLGAHFSFEGVALHELGHALGLGHEDRGLATMNSLTPNGGPVGHWKEWEPLPDDRAGERALYPDSTVETDIVGSVFRSTGGGNSGLVASPTSVYRGSPVNVDFTFHNLSTSWVSFNIGFYLSTDNYITTGDIPLGYNTGASASAGASGTYTRTLTIPSNVAPGQYYLGFIVDYDNKIGESVESNNYMEMPRPITVYAAGS